MVENLADIFANRTVHAMDALGETGLSEQTVPMRDMADQAMWVDELFWTAHP
ncbi:hypothetical protein [Pseudonocardia sp. GCM10023141]|uniref:hypothetical protein n=1 Tax=Pseudonocardia sp. GCM10023141 TaxID=3252653 RepID=UPI00361E678E